MKQTLGVMRDDSAVSRTNSFFSRVLVILAQATPQRQDSAAPGEKH